MVWHHRLLLNARCCLRWLSDRFCGLGHRFLGRLFQRFQICPFLRRRACVQISLIYRCSFGGDAPTKHYDSRTFCPGRPQVYRDALASEEVWRPKWWLWRLIARISCWPCFCVSSSQQMRQLMESRVPMFLLLLQPLMAQLPPSHPIHLQETKCRRQARPPHPAALPDGNLSCQLWPWASEIYFIEYSLYVRPVGPSPGCAYSDQWGVGRPVSKSARGFHQGASLLPRALRFCPCVTPISFETPRSWFSDMQVHLLSPAPRRKPILSYWFDTWYHQTHAC